jgi:hypothetical protein
MRNINIDLNDTARPRIRLPAPAALSSAMALLTPTERLMLEIIRDLHHLPSERVEWALGKGYAELVGKQKRLRLTEAGVEALKSDAEQRIGVIQKRN